MERKRLERLEDFLADGFSPLEYCSSLTASLNSTAEIEDKVTYLKTEKSAVEEAFSETVETHHEYLVKKMKQNHAIEQKLTYYQSSIQKMHKNIKQTADGFEHAVNEIQRVVVQTENVQQTLFLTKQIVRFRMLVGKLKKVYGVVRGGSKTKESETSETKQKIVEMNSALVRREVVKASQLLNELRSILEEWRESKVRFPFLEADVAFTTEVQDCIEASCKAKFLVSMLKLNQSEIGFCLQVLLNIGSATLLDALKETFLVVAVEMVRTLLDGLELNSVSSQTFPLTKGILPPESTESAQKRLDNTVGEFKKKLKSFKASRELENAKQYEKFVLSSFVGIEKEWRKIMVKIFNLQKIICKKRDSSSQRLMIDVLRPALLASEEISTKNLDEHAAPFILFFSSFCGVLESTMVELFDGSGSGSNAGIEYLRSLCGEVVYEKIREVLFSFLLKVKAFLNMTKTSINTSGEGSMVVEDNFVWVKKQFLKCFNIWTSAYLNQLFSKNVTMQNKLFLNLEKTEGSKSKDVTDLLKSLRDVYYEQNGKSVISLDYDIEHILTRRKKLHLLQTELVSRFQELGRLVAIKNEEAKGREPVDRDLLLAKHKIGLKLLDTVATKVNSLIIYNEKYFVFNSNNLVDSKKFMEANLIVVGMLWEVHGIVSMSQTGEAEIDKDDATMEGSVTRSLTTFFQTIFASLLYHSTTRFSRLTVFVGRTVEPSRSEELTSVTTTLITFIELFEKQNKKLGSEPLYHKLKEAFLDVLAYRFCLCLSLRKLNTTESSRTIALEKTLTELEAFSCFITRLNKQDADASTETNNASHLRLENVATIEACTEFLQLLSKDGLSSAKHGGLLVSLRSRPGVKRCDLFFMNFLVSLIDAESEIRMRNLAEQLSLKPVDFAEWISTIQQKLPCSKKSATGQKDSFHFFALGNVHVQAFNKAVSLLVRRELQQYQARVAARLRTGDAMSVEVGEERGARKGYVELLKLLLE